MIRTYKYPLEPNRRQTVVLLEWLERCRVLYNVALEQRRDWWRIGRKSLTYFDQAKELTELRAADPIYEAIPAQVCRSSLCQLHRAFEGFFRRVKRGETPGYPRFKGSGRLTSFGIGRVSIQGKKVRVPKLGLVKFRKYRELCGKILDVRIIFKAEKWHVAFSCDVGEVPEKQSAKKAVGIDVGLKSFVTISDGTKIDNPRFFRNAEQTIARYQRALAKKKRGSKARARARMLVQRAHARVRNQRLDFARKLASSLLFRFDCVFYEDLNIGALAAGKLAKSVKDAAWGIFIRALICKAECAGRWAVPVDPRGTSARCSSCGTSATKTLSDRVHRCTFCRLEMDRDENAARNILALGRSAAVVFGQSPN